MRKTTAVLSASLLLVFAAAAEAQEKDAKKGEVQVEAGLLSVKLDKAPAGELFQKISEQGKMVVRLDETLLKAPVTEEFDNLPLEEGLRRLIGQLKTDNFVMAYVAEPGGQRRVVSVEILARGSPGVAQQLGSVSARVEEPAGVPKGIKKRIERGLNKGGQKQFERTGKMPQNVTKIPLGLLLKKERGEDLGPGSAWKFERALKYSAGEGSGAPETKPPAE